MYWLLEYQFQNEVRDTIRDLVDEVLSVDPYVRQPFAKYFPFPGRKALNIADIVIQHLSETNELVIDPFIGSGVFLYSALMNDRRLIGGDIDQYPIRMVKDLLKGRNKTRFDSLYSKLIGSTQGLMSDLYKTKCSCGQPMIIKSIYFDQEPLEYVNPTPHERIHQGGENVVFTSSTYSRATTTKCPVCGLWRKKFDQDDLKRLSQISNMSVANFTNHSLLINSRINITPGRSDSYDFFFTHRAKVALNHLWNNIQSLQDCHEKMLIEDAFLATLHIAMITDYRTSSQDLYHIPLLQCKENSVWWHFQDRVYRLTTAQDYLSDEISVSVEALGKLELTVEEVVSRNEPKIWNIGAQGFRATLRELPDSSCDLMLTDPPYTDQIPYLERHQLYYPWLGLNMSQIPLDDEVVITDAPTRITKRSRDQYFQDIDSFFEESSRIVKIHKYLILYFHPAKQHWAQDLNYFKLLARKHGFEPLQNIDISRVDPTVRKQNSAAWEFNNELIIVYIRLDEEERYWFDDDVWVDKEIYRAAVKTAEDKGGSFSIQQFNTRLYETLRVAGKLNLTGSAYQEKVLQTLERYCDFQGGLYSLKRGSPFEYIIGRMSVIQRIRDFTPLVVEELLNIKTSFTYPDFVLRLSQYLDNGERELIDELERDESLIETTLETYVIESTDGVLIRKPEFDIDIYASDGKRVNLLGLDPYEFEQLVGELLEADGYSNVSVIGRSGDRGIDLIAVDQNSDDLYIQVKRWRYNVPATPIQRVHSASVSRGAVGSWVITTSDFTKDAIDEAENYTGTKLTNGQELMRLLEAYFPGRFKIGDS